MLALLAGGGLEVYPCLPNISVESPPRGWGRTREQEKAPFPVQDCGALVTQTTQNGKFSVVKWQSLTRVRLFATPWNSPGQNTGVGSLSLLGGIFPIQGSNPSLLHCRWILYPLSYEGSPGIDQFIVENKMKPYELSWQMQMSWTQSVMDTGTKGCKTTLSPVQWHILYPKLQAHRVKMFFKNCGNK